MSIDQVKQDLPNVRVKLPNGRIIVGYLSGRQRSFAHVIADRGNGWESIGEWSWVSVTNAVNAGRPLLS
jgi:ethanolamine utilization microcompartment shell protein EutS